MKYSSWGDIKKILILVITFSLFLLTNQLVIAEPIGESIIYVSKSSIGNFSTIQDALDSAESGDTIYAYNGTYFENIVIDKSIILIGEDKNNTIIDGRETGNTIKVNADNVTIQSFTIQHSGLIFPNSGINLSSNYNLIEDNIIMYNFYGMTLYRSSWNTIRGSIIQNDINCGIYLSKSSDNTIIDNTIRCHTYNGLGVYDSSDRNIIQSNDLNHNSFCAVNIRTSSDNNVIDNNISDNNIGIHLPSSENTVSGNVFSNNNIDVEREFSLSESESILIFVIIMILCILGIIFCRRMRKKKG